MHLDGTHVTQATRSGLIGFLTEKNAYGGNYVGTDRWFDGLMDEIRISTVARSSNWIWASRLTTISNESFTAYGGVSGNVPALIAAETVLVDFGNDASYRGASVVNPDSNGNAWNSVWSGAYYPALIDISNHTTAIGLGFDSAPGTDSYNGPAGVIVAGALGALGGATNAVNDYYVNASFQLQGLNTGRTYRLTFFGSHAYSDDDATIYSVYTGGFHTGLVGSVSLNVQQPGAPDRHNSNSVAVLSGLVPAANGSFYVSFIGNQGHNGYLNALMLESFNPALDYDRWSLNYPGLGPRLADDDGDGLANLLEFGFGGNPTQASDRGFATDLHIGLHAGETLLMHSYRRRSAEAGLSYRAEWSTNLLNATWLTNGLQQQPAAPLGDGFEAVTNSLPLLDPQRYLRIVLEEP